MMDLRAYSQCLAFAAEILGYMAGELVWILEKWGEGRGATVEFWAGKVEEERIV